MPPLIYFIRHGQTDWNAEERFQGQKDIPINRLGQEQAARNGAALKGVIEPDQFDFVASPMERTRETMRIVRKNLGVDPDEFRTDERLKELSFGAWEGHTVAELRHNAPDLWQQRSENKWHFCPPDGESYDMLARRLQGWLDDVKKPTVVVSHGGVNRALRAIVLNDRSNQMASAPTPQDQIMVLMGRDIRWL